MKNTNTVHLQIKSLTVERGVWWVRDTNDTAWRLGFNGIDAPLKMRSALARGERPWVTVEIDMYNVIRTMRMS
jgi:hypothetical protein